MERMAAPLKSVVTLLRESHCKSPSSSKVTKIPMGTIASAMLDCIQGIHDKGLVFVDVKSDNFIISLSQRIRLIDFGLLESINDLSSGKHREDMHPNAPLVGTPSYTSINVMSGHTPSRRDDLEALGYVVNDDNILPWSAAKSDDELLKMKLQEMDKSKRSKSKFFTRLKAAGTDTVMVNYFNAVQSLKYAETPDYDALRCYLKKLVV
ncbi:protein kinase, partial [Thalassiosira pseudonana CCMP1335]